MHLLLHPPFADPTQPYLSLPTLKGYLRARKLDARVVDLNVEAAHHLFEKETLEDLARRLGLRFLRLNHAQSLDFEEQREYRALAGARLKIEEVLGAEVSPIEVFQTRELFHDAAQYSLARRRVEALFDALSAVHFPYRFDFNNAGHDVLPWSFDLLESYSSGQSSPLDAFYRKVFEPPADWDSLEEGVFTVPLDGTELIGISVVFPSQIPEAFYLARFLKERAPDAFIALGGPCIHQVVVHMEPALKRRVLSFADGVGLFEGEETIAKLLPLLPEWRSAGSEDRRLEVLRSVPNLLLWDHGAGKPRTGPPFVLDLAAAPAPDYSDLDLDRYLAPSRTLLYAPTRGCYWNKCSFCYYGLSETATAVYREVPPDRAAADLARLSQRHGVRNFYISCDVLSPSYAVRFADALIARGLKIRWSSDLKIEKSFTPERCDLLYRSGLRSAAFGIESGSDRILDLMRKGCDRGTMTEVNRSFHDAGIATEWMTFTDHPDETLDEALETVLWIEEESERIDLFIVGEFGLERGSHIAEDPARYGVEKVYYAEGDELRLYALFTQRGGERSSEDRERIDRAVRRASTKYALHPYPWAGANSTHHTFLHFVEFGQRAFRTHFQPAQAAVEGALAPPPPSHIAGLHEYLRFSLEAIEEREREFFEGYLSRALYTTVGGRRAGGREVALLSREHFEAAAAEVPPLRPGKRQGLR
ncbi:MAG TPA: radical SAM protein [Planctomycetota bacterium]|nr:radical SAM protein [Planctomycetota bacterium]